MEPCGYVGVPSASMGLSCTSSAPPTASPSPTNSPLQNVADVSLTEELLNEEALGDKVARKFLGDLAYRSEDQREALAEVGILFATERSERYHGAMQHIEIAISSLKRGSLAWARLWPPRSWGWLPGSRRR